MTDGTIMLDWARPQGPVTTPRTHRTFVIANAAH